MIVTLLLLLCATYMNCEDLVELQCDMNCKIINNKITAREGVNTTLTYNVYIKDFLMVQIKSHNDILLTLQNTGKLLPKPKNPLDFVKLNNVSHQTLKGFYFTIELININRTNRNFELSSAITQSDGSSQTNEKILDITYGPELTKKWVPNYELQENENKNIIFELSGNPKPSVTAELNGQQLHVSWVNSSNIYTYTISINNARRTSCGKKMKMTAESNDKINKLVLDARIDVLFVPDVPSGLTASYNGTNGVQVGWNAVESGECPVNYTLEYTFGGNKTATTAATTITTTTATTEITATTAILTTKDLLTSSSSTSRSIILPPSNNASYMLIRVRVEAEGGFSNWSTPFNLSIDNTHITPDTHSDHTAIIVSCCVVAVLIVIAMVVAVLIHKGHVKVSCTPQGKKPSVDSPRGGGGGGGSIVVKNVNHGSDNAGLESDYACIGNVKPQQNSVHAMEYAELGPGGRIEDREGEEKIYPSNYAQVDTSKAYYPSLNPQAPTNKPPSVKGKNGGGVVASQIVDIIDM